MRTVYIHCDGGLGRRFNSLVSGICLANSLNWNYEIRWPINDQCACGIEEIFDGNFKQVTIIPEDVTYYAQWSINEHTIDPFYFKTRQEIVDHALNAQKDVFYCSFSIPSWAFKIDIYNIITKLLKFKDSLIKKSEDFINKNNLKDYYGLHLRRTDHTTKIDEDFFHNLILHNRNQKFFVCSDEQELESKFGKLSNVIIYPKRQWVVKIDEDKDWDGGLNLHRSKISILDAAVDLLILSRSEILNTNVNSNFLKLAVILNGYNNYIREGNPPELRLGMRITRANINDSQQILGSQP